MFQIFMKKGFTLIELLVVIAIIGVLSSIVLVSMGSARLKARDVARQSDMRQIITAQAMYYIDNEAYATAVGSDAGTQPIAGYVGVLTESKTGHANYVWKKNDAAVITGCTNGEYFCVYATLEEKDADGVTQYFLASERGTKKTITLPDDLYGVAGNHCTCF